MERPGGAIVGREMVRRQIAPGRLAGGVGGRLEGQRPPGARPVSEPAGLRRQAENEAQLQRISEGADVDLSRHRGRDECSP